MAALGCSARLVGPSTQPRLRRLTSCIVQRAGGQGEWGAPGGRREEGGERREEGGGGGPGADFQIPSLQGGCALAAPSADSHDPASSVELRGVMVP